MESPAYVATNLAESMVTSRVPTIAESNDIANTLLDGVHGLVLAAETAVGIDPVGSVDMVLRGIGRSSAPRRSTCWRTTGRSCRPDEWDRSTWHRAGEAPRGRALSVGGRP